MNHIQQTQCFAQLEAHKPKFSNGFLIKITSIYTLIATADSLCTFECDKFS